MNSIKIGVLKELPLGRPDHIDQIIDYDGNLRMAILWRWWDGSVMLNKAGWFDLSNGEYIRELTL